MKILQWFVHTEGIKGSLTKYLEVPTEDRRTSGRLTQLTGGAESKDTVCNETQQTLTFTAYNPLTYPSKVNNA